MSKYCFLPDFSVLDFRLLGRMTEPESKPLTYSLIGFSLNPCAFRALAA